ncbi:hypothetical protein JHW43_005465 [Diplocarpon mali]|nr:hypothetical protein JHW43_005465 [Diplocarpon mali]
MWPQIPRDSELHLTFYDFLSQGLENCKLAPLVAACIVKSQQAGPDVHDAKVLLLRQTPAGEGDNIKEADVWGMIPPPPVPPAAWPARAKRVSLWAFEEAAEAGHPFAGVWATTDEARQLRMTDRTTALVIRALDRANADA